MQTSCATDEMHKKYQGSSDFMQQIVKIVNQHHTGQPFAEHAMLRNMIDHEWAPLCIVLLFEVYFMTLSNISDYKTSVGRMTSE
jgi:hypothetical protein